jgi:hypothetical protein
MRVQPSGYRHEVTASHVLVIMHALVSLPHAHTHAHESACEKDTLRRASARAKRRAPERHSTRGKKNHVAAAGGNDYFGGGEYPSDLG